MKPKTRPSQLALASVVDFVLAIVSPSSKRKSRKRCTCIYRQSGLWKTDRIQLTQSAPNHARSQHHAMPNPALAMPRQLHIKKHPSICAADLPREWLTALSCPCSTTFTCLPTRHSPHQRDTTRGFHGWMAGRAVLLCPLSPNQPCLLLSRLQGPAAMTVDHESLLTGPASPGIPFSPREIPPR